MSIATSLSVASQDGYVVDSNGDRIAVIVDFERYRRLCEAEEELECIRAYDAAKASNDDAIPFDQAVAEIERDAE